LGFGRRELTFNRSQMVRVRAMRTLENAARRWGFYRVAGCDEVGRGCLAGPVVAGAVILDPDCHIPGLADSKTITAAERERLHALITRKALAWSVAWAEPEEIDAINIHQASLQAMRRAVLAIAPLPDIVLVDAFRIPDLEIAQRGVLHGDRRCAAIAAASIVAKVTRDRVMRRMDALFPRYGFSSHVGYITPSHSAAVRRHGPCEQHRMSFQALCYADIDVETAVAAA
jgi:ribonuclease HII